PRPRARPVGHARRRTTPVRRRSAGLTPTRAAALLVMLGAVAAGYGLVGSPVFALERLDIRGATLTSEDQVRETLGLPVGARVNLVTLDTAELVGRLERLPTVRAADVAVGLPGTVVVTVTDRAAILVWQAGDRRLLVDVDGHVVAELTAGAPLPDPSLPVISDSRASAGALAVGSTLDPIDLDAARRLASLRPADVASAASALAVAVDETDGYTLAPTSGGWVAVFGFYTPSQRTTDMIPGQVRLLRSLLAGREPSVGRVVLASATDGTYVPRATPKGSASPAAGPGKSASPNASPSPAP
ncbi:MAG TPA: FtsQ-type POTRA domain-containing protein, partial [Candidatus Dormibacteraeota bacterium]|nr:FtsQ-type POTRA domain-containing protein [Candidatus Dormibacteraeota bacterium]